MAQQRNRPGDVLLDLLRSAGSRGQSVGGLLASGRLFGFSDNTLRVTLSRLCSRGLVESPKRGWYHLTPRTSGLNTFVERWRLGEQRLRPWRPGHWLFAHLASNSNDSPADGACHWTLTALGFRSLQPSLWIRPDNLALTMAELHTLASGMGLDPDVLLVAGTPDLDPEAAGWQHLWQAAALADQHQQLSRQLQQSCRSLASLSHHAARLETFRLGGAAINALAKDPLLPAEFSDPAPRQALHQAMLAYDIQGRRIWAAKDSGITTLPVQQQGLVAPTEHPGAPQP